MVQLGATPVFVDVEPDTWCIDPKAIEAAITPKTKAIMVVHMFGHPADMDPINAIAAKHNLIVIEDAAPSLGSSYKGVSTGHLSRAGAFSFHAAKLVAAGEGGMICSDDEELMHRIEVIANHGRDTPKYLYCVDWGCKYNMGNLQAAMGLGQVERLEELIAKKKQNFAWYQEELGGIEGITWNVERPGCRANYSTMALVFNRDFGISRDDLIRELAAVKIDSRPFFYPISSLPMVNRDLSKQNPVAYHVGHQGLNLPNRHDLTREQVAYIGQEMKRLLNV
jgi:perosamine synthetase